MSPGTQPAAAGARQPYAQVALPVRTWVQEQLGAPVVHAETQDGGMSPGCAARLRAADGATAFVKAVSAESNPRTPKLFRHEIAVLSRLPPAEYRPDLLATYDDGTWVALLFADVDGDHPDLRDADQAAAVWSTVEAQARELTPAPDGLEIDILADNTRRWADGWATMAADPAGRLPAWATPRVDGLTDRVAALADRLSTESLCHWDVRNDNLLLRADGSVVIFDWGMARRGPSWGDLFMLCLAWADHPRFDEDVARLDADPHVVTDLLLGLGGWLALRSSEPAPPGIPTMPAFQRREANRLLIAAERRLSRE